MSPETTAEFGPAPSVDTDLDAAERWLIDWLITEAWRIKNPRTLIREVCGRLVATGVPLDTFTAFVLTLHPDYFGVAHRWRRDADEVTSTLGSHELWNTAMVQKSPLRVVREGADAFRWKLAVWGEHPEYQVLNDLRADGATDYAAMRLPFQDGSPQTITFTTHDPAGFTTAQLSLVDRLLFYLARLTEVQAINYLATVLLDTYVGRQSGNEVMSGKIRRGEGQTIRAVILMTDLRQFTTLSDQLDRDDLLELLNDYFDAVGRPVQRRRGEILKFIGDAMLAVFPVEANNADEQRACQNALDAVIEANTDIVAQNNARRFAGKPAIRFVSALHVGDVMWGNIGTSGRLDFTVIGPAVNLVSRIEGLTGALDEPVLMSGDFVAAGGIDATGCGAHMVKGLEAPIDVYRPASNVASNATSNGTP